jgi:hypothetical protein
MVDFWRGRWTGSIRSTKERIMSVRSRRLAFAAVTAATAIVVPTAALASGSSTPSGKPAPCAAAAKPAAASKPAASKSGAAGGSAAAIKSAARQSAASSASMSAMVAALATRLGVSHSAAQRALNQVEALGREGIDPATPPFAAIAHDLGVSPAQLSDALRAAKQSLVAGR